MQEDQFLGYVSHYHDARPRGGKGWLFWTSLVIHAAVLIAIVVTPLYQVSADLPQFEAMSAFMVTPSAPPPPPPAALPRSSSSSRGGQQPRLAPRSDFIAPVVIPTDIPVEDFGAVDFGVPGGVEGGVPGGIVGGIVGGIPASAAPPPPAAPQEPVRVDFRQQEARPVHRVDPVYPDLAAQAHVQASSSSRCSSTSTACPRRRRSCAAFPSSTPPPSTQCGSGGGTPTRAEAAPCRSS